MTYNNVPYYVVICGENKMMKLKLFIYTFINKISFNNIYVTIMYYIKFDVANVVQPKLAMYIGTRVS